ncbi:MAG: DNA/RNA nuclease SfsA [Pseudohongiellaceae bacterium]|nr:DNA/RNA nuclease SfsA [Pseudohongiellaceae bacterium]
MKFPSALQQAVLIKRYKRFLADVRLADGSEMTIHCPNTGSMLNCAEANSLVWYSTSENKKRKYPHTWEIVQDSSGARIGINTGLANRLVAEALERGKIEALTGYEKVQAEVKYGQEGSRVDFLLSAEERPDCYIEVKNLTLMLEPGLGAFPDAVSTRAHKHLRELMEMKSQGYRAVLLYCVQHEGIQQVKPAAAIDPQYAQLLKQAKNAGVEVVALRARFSANEITLEESIPVSVE